MTYMVKCHASPIEGSAFLPDFVSPFFIKFLIFNDFNPSFLSRDGAEVRTYMEKFHTPCIDD